MIEKESATSQGSAPGAGPVSSFCLDWDLDNPAQNRTHNMPLGSSWNEDSKFEDPARAFLADLAKDNHRKMRIAKCILLILHGGWQCSRLCGWQLYKFLPFTLSHGCDTYCANLKTCWLPSFSIPFALASMFSSDSGAGHGRSLGVLNLAIVIPQMFVSLLSGLWDELFGGGNLLAFMVGVVAALIDAFLAFFVLPPPSSNA